MKRLLVPALAVLGAGTAMLSGSHDARAVEAVVGGIETVTINLTSIDPAIPADQTITCSATLSEFDSVYSNSASSGANVIRSGTKGTCTITIHYLFTIVAGTKGSLSFSVSSGQSGVEATSHSVFFSGAPITFPSGTAGNLKNAFNASM